MAQVNTSGTKAVTIDFNDKSTFVAKGKVSKLDPTADSFEQGKPAAMGTYNLKLTAGKDGIQADKIDPEKDFSDDNVYYKANMECVIQDSKDGLYDGLRVFPTVTTRLGRGKMLSTMADMIVRCGFGKHLKEEMTDFDVAALFNKVLAKEPVLKGVECDWEGGYKASDGSWKNVFKTMTDFPVDPKGGHLAVVMVKDHNRQNQEVKAQLKVKKWPMGAKPVDESKNVKTVPVKAKNVPKETLPEEPTVNNETVDDDDLLS
jgi:hypothetical protein